MTEEEIERDLERFTDYLEANGSRSIAIVLLTSDNLLYARTGLSENLNEIAVRLLADGRGYKLVLK